MPGVPKSTACQQCKGRRTRCDKKWPECSPCRRKGLVCSGPDAQIKFVYGGFKADHAATRAESQLEPHEQSRLEKALLSNDDGLRDTLALRGSSGPVMGKFRLTSVPRKLTIPAEAVGSRLVHCLDDKTSWLFATSGSSDPSYRLQENPFVEVSWAFTAYMSSIPARLGHNAGLCDVVDLFCAGYVDYRRRIVQSNTRKVMELYGKALRTLQKTLKGTQARDLETLAAIVLLSRAEYFFNYGQKPSPYPHAEVIRILSRGLGQPRPDHRFHHVVLYLSMEELVLQSFTKEEHGVTAQSPFKEWFEKAAIGAFPPGLLHSGQILVEFLGIFSATGPRFLGKIRRIYQHTESMVDLATKIAMVVLPIDCKRINDTINELVDEATQMGVLKKVIDPSYHMAGEIENYGSRATSFGGAIFTGLAFLIGMARICCDLRVLYGLPDADTYYDIYYKACVQMWTLTPQQLDMHRTVMCRSVWLVILTYEAALEEHEREYLESVLLEYDHGSHGVPRDKEERRVWIMKEVKVMTGRLPLASK